MYNYSVEETSTNIFKTKEIALSDNMKGSVRIITERGQLPNLI